VVVIIEGLLRRMAYLLIQENEREQVCVVRKEKLSMHTLERESRIWYFRERKKICVFEVNCACLGKRTSRKRHIYGKAINRSQRTVQIKVRHLDFVIITTGSNWMFNQR